MPATQQTNGHGDASPVTTNGHSATAAAEINLGDGETFLFTSESVGEGHPGEFIVFFIAMEIIYLKKNN